jgi:hypothetical protein
MESNIYVETTSSTYLTHIFNKYRLLHQVCSINERDSKIIKESRCEYDHIFYSNKVEYHYDFFTDFVNILQCNNCPDVDFEEYYDVSIKFNLKCYSNVDFAKFSDYIYHKYADFWLLALRNVDKYPLSFVTKYNISPVCENIDLNEILTWDNYWKYHVDYLTTVASYCYKSESAFMSNILLANIDKIEEIYCAIGYIIPLFGKPLQLTDKIHKKYPHLKYHRLYRGYS